MTPASPIASPPRVLVSYSHDSDEHRDRVLALSNRLRREGVDCIVDQYEQAPPEGWPTWCNRQIEKADFVLVVCTNTYLRRFRKEEERGRGLGVTFEGHIITQELYDAQGSNSKFIPIVFSEEDWIYLPNTLKGGARFKIDQQYDDLYRLLTNQPRTPMPGLGVLKAMQKFEPLEELAGKPKGPEEGPAEYDVFISFNSDERDEVRKLALELQGASLRVFWDEWSLPPGADWVVRLSEGLLRSKAFAIVIGKSGLGGWQQREISVAFDQQVKKKYPVIPVMLRGCAGAKAVAELAFLPTNTWVDLRSEPKDKEMFRLVWGITGKRPPDHKETEHPPDPRVNRSTESALSELCSTLESDNVTYSRSFNSKGPTAPAADARTLRSPCSKRVFLCHSNGDKAKVREFYHRLSQDGVNPWLDEEDLLPGQAWEPEIRKAVKSSAAVLAFFSSTSVSSAGYVHKEIQLALDVADEQPPGTIFLIPARLEECEVPERLQHIHWVDLYQANGYEKLLRTLKTQGLLNPTVAAAPVLEAASLPKPRAVSRRQVDLRPVRTNPKNGLTYVWIPPGHFRLGCSEGDSGCVESEKPAHDVEITRGFWLSLTPVTQAAYEKVTGKTPSRFKGNDLPLERVSWEQARDYCAAAGGRLPTEAEWEYAARGGIAAARYGSLDDIAWHRGNSSDTTHTVGQKVANRFGLHDMLGNVWEWTADWYGDYQSRESRDPQGPLSGTEKVLRGGSWLNNPAFLRASNRYSLEPGIRHSNIGFRCVWEQRFP